eukprot:876565-Pyramimonas_sp.AAC.2
MRGQNHPLRTRSFTPGGKSLCQHTILPRHELFHGNRALLISLFKGGAAVKESQLQVRRGGGCVHLPKPATMKEHVTECIYKPQQIAQPESDPHGPKSLISTANLP